jgi:hypothetical protein
MVINIKFSNHFLNRIKERCEFLYDDDILNFLSTNFTTGIINYSPKINCFYLGIPNLNAKIPLEKISGKNYFALTYIKNIVYLHHSKPCTIKWIYEYNPTLDKKSFDLEEIASNELY